MSDTDKPAEPIVRQFAIVEIFGHRKHWAEIADVERAGGKFLRVHDVETDEVHNYGAAAVFNIHEISEARLNAHLAEVAAYKQATAEREARWAAEEEARRNARLLAVRERCDSKSRSRRMIADADGEWNVEWRAGNMTPDREIPF